MLNTSHPDFSACFKAYDIRGIVDQPIDADFAYHLGVALVTPDIKTVLIGRDGRLSGPSLSEGLQQGLRDAGANVIDLGPVPTPLVYFASEIFKADAAIAITGSHNPPDYNGFKMVVHGQAIYGDMILALKEKMHKRQSTSHITKGNYQTHDIVPDYIQAITSHITLARPMTVAIDCGNGIAGSIAPQLMKALNAQTIDLFCEVDGTFPNHHPDPADPKNLQDLAHCLATSDAEIGLAFDGDGDRLGVVTKTGDIIWPDRQLILFARDVLERAPGATIIYDVKCSQQVTQAIESAGGQALMWKTGHSLVKAKLKETGAPLAGEMSGHIFFKERWFGFDDGLYAAARLLEILSRTDNPTELLNALPQAYSTPELKIPTQEGEQFEIIKELQNKAQFPEDVRLCLIDGLRADYKNGFGLARASNTTPVIVLRFEGETPAVLQQIQEAFKSALQSVAPHLKFPL